MKYKKILFVCGGNQCRSPIAAAIFKDIVGKDTELCSAGIEVKSAGIFYEIDGVPAVDDAISVIKKFGLDISSHKAQHISQTLVDWADIILVMEHEQEEYITYNFQDAKEKVFLFTEFIGGTGDIFAPTGHGTDTYSEFIRLLKSLLSDSVKIMKRKYAS
jgi:protein-tyrosine-phosphatase